MTTGSKLTKEKNKIAKVLIGIHDAFLKQI